MKITSELRNRLKSALREDIGPGDITSRTLIPPYVRGKAVIVAKEPGIFAGESIAREIFRLTNPKIRTRFFVKDGDSFQKGKKLAEIQGPVIGLLEAERTVLNLIGHLSGIASRTREFVDRVKKYKVTILDTRKTTPLWRELEKAAVKAGGGKNHRMGLYDAVFVKENHRRFGDLTALRNHSGKFEIEVRNARETMEALMLSPKVILFDNFEPSVLKETVKMARQCSPRVIFEASGGVNLNNVEAYAKTGVDQISIGSLTHSVKAIDLSMLIP